MYWKSVLLLFWFAENWSPSGPYNKKLSCLRLKQTVFLNSSLGSWYVINSRINLQSVSRKNSAIVNSERKRGRGKWMWIKMLDIPPAKWTKEMIFVILSWDIKPTSTPSRGNYKERKMNTHKASECLNIFIA